MMKNLEGCDFHRYETRLKMARSPSLKTLEEFDFSVFSDKRIGVRVRELATGYYIPEHFNILIHGATGLWKTHLSISLGIRATQQAYSTLFIEAKDLLPQTPPPSHKNTRRKNSESGSRPRGDWLPARSAAKPSSDREFVSSKDQLQVQNTIRENWKCSDNSYKTTRYKNQRTKPCTPLSLISCNP